MINLQFQNGYITKISFTNSLSKLVEIQINKTRYITPIQEKDFALTVCADYAVKKLYSTYKNIENIQEHIDNTIYSYLPKNFMESTKAMQILNERIKRYVQKSNKNEYVTITPKFLECIDVCRNKTLANREKERRIEEFSKTVSLQKK